MAHIIPDSGQHNYQLCKGVRYTDTRRDQLERDSGSFLRSPKFHGELGTQERKIVMAQGTIKFFLAKKGFGFIQPDDGGDDVFVHYAEIEDDGGDGKFKMLYEGDRVEYEPVHSSKGTQAKHVVKIDSSPENSFYTD